MTVLAKGNTQTFWILPDTGSSLTLVSGHPTEPLQSTEEGFMEIRGHTESCKAHLTMGPVKPETCL